MSSTNLNADIMTHNCPLCPKTKQNELNIYATDYTRFVCNQCYSKYKIEQVFSIFGFTDNYNDMINNLINENKKKKEETAKLKLKEFMKSLEDDLDEKTVNAILNTVDTKPKKSIYPEGLTENEKRKIYDSNRKGRPDKKIKVKCICSKNISIGTMSAHIKTKGHTEMLKLNKDNIDQKDLEETDWKKWSTVIESRSNASSNTSTNNSTGYNSDDDDEKE
jgi:transcription elongation factor Elf1